MKQKNYQIMIGWVVAAIYIAVLVKITVLRQDFLAHPLFSHGAVGWAPAIDYIRMLQKREIFSFIVLFFGNIAWFVPFGILLPVLTGRPKTTAGAAAAGFLLSFCIEFAQYAFGTGISETNDLILNTLGAALGFLLLKYIRRKSKRSRRKE